MTLTSDDFRSFTNDYFKTQHGLDLATSFDWDKWFFAPGMPSDMERLFDDSLCKTVADLVDLWVAPPALGHVAAGGPVTYEVNLSVAPDVVEAFLAWLAPHMDEMLTMDGFQSADMGTIQDFQSDKDGEAGYHGFVVSYRVRDMTSLQDYLDNHAAAMRANNPFTGGCRAWRRVLQHVRRPTSADQDGWSTAQIVRWITAVFEHHVEAAATAGAPGCLTVADVNHMDELYRLSSRRNAEIRFCWQRLCMAVGKVDAVPAVVAFLREQGRMKFVRPLFRDLLQASVSYPEHAATFRSAAVDTFSQAESSYHPICAKMVRRDLAAHAEKHPAP
jgi:hypothetical protein